jgi:hypothetical protein
MGASCRRVAVAWLALVAAGALAGCGGGGTHYSLPATKACFTKQGYPVLAQANHALPGSGGNLRISLGPGYGMEEVFVVFGRDSTEAKAIESRAVDLAEKTFAARNLVLPRNAVLAGVRVSGNVFYYSSTGPISELVHTLIQSCLR